MSSIQDIEEAIETLSLREQEELYAWMDERYERVVDEKIALSLDSGVMDERIQHALRDLETGNTRAL